MKNKFISILTAVLVLVLVIPMDTGVTAGISKTAPRQMEYLDRGTIAVKVDEGVYLSWRLLGTENYDTAFDVYRDNTKIATVSDSTNYVDTKGRSTNTYRVVPEGKTGDKSVSVWGEQYMTIPLEVPEGGTSYEGNPYTYSPNDASCADLDGDGEYEIILKWDPSNSRDSGKAGEHTGNVYLDAYKLDGTRLWRMDLGVNILAGAHYTQFIAYDFDLDGKAELAFRTAPGTKDGQGNYVSEASESAAIRDVDNTVDYRTESGLVLTGDEYYTVFQGDTGRALDTIYYPQPRGLAKDKLWGDDWGNRSERFLCTAAYLDGIHPSIVTWRGYYGGKDGAPGRTGITSYLLENKKLVQQFIFDTRAGEEGYREGYEQYIGQGNHNLTVADVDSDGCDEIICGSLCMENDLTPKWCTFEGHGDALHLGDYDPEHEGMEYFRVCEDGVKAYTDENGAYHPAEGYGMSVIDAATGEIMFHVDADNDTGRGVMANVGPLGYYQFWGAGSYKAMGGRAFMKTGEELSGASSNFRIFWDGDLYDELLDGTAKRNGAIGISAGLDGSRIFTISNAITNNDTKNNVCLQADLLGDWREEVVARASTNDALHVYTTTISTEHKLYTLMHDPAYRMQVSAQNGGYNQPPHIGYFVSEQENSADQRQMASYVSTVHQGQMAQRDKNIPILPPTADPTVEPAPSVIPSSKPTPTPTLPPMVELTPPPPPTQTSTLPPETQPTPTITPSSEPITTPTLPPVIEPTPTVIPTVAPTEIPVNQMPYQIKGARWFEEKLQTDVCKNSQYNLQKAVFAAAGYDGEGRLISVSLKELSAFQQEEFTVETEFSDIPTQTQCFIWNLETMQPYADSYRVER